ncbi:hypothetical protein BDW02DRAFT_118146 [Decorospora gaudefroyi]|uniref:Uncharacterized protein n=1 Tax=Decorospora gaudefroyi TaxID=184978 RepID=A0A6A5KNR9_9PLEO|nr:hypothetical protein BDW02DRAFT_118146 [Decorospora gaudefroyi]
MTAAPTARPLFLVSHHMQSDYLLPASTIASDTSFPWTPMSPRQESNEPCPRKSPGASRRAPPASDGGFVFVTANSLEEMKSKDNMHKVRKTAMASYLKTEKSHDKTKSKTDSEVSDKSRSSVETSNPRTIAPLKRKRANGREPSSSTESETVMTQITTAPTPCTQVVRTRESCQTVLSQARIVVPIDLGKEYAFDVTPMPLLVSIGESLDPFRTMFQSHHPRVSVTRLKHHCSRYFGTRGLGKHWIPACLDHPHTFLSTLYMASQHHDVLQRREVESLETAALRQDIIHMVGGNLANPEKSVADHNIIAVSQLILGEVIGRTEASLAFHQAGMENMIRQRGGLKYLGINGYLASAVSWAHLATAILQETRPRPMYAEYCASRKTKNYSLATTIPESPIYCPHGRYVTIERSIRCTPGTQRLLNDMRMMIEDFLPETKQSRRNSDRLMSLYNRITQYPSIQRSRKGNVLRDSDWKYEAIRITAVLQAYAIIHRIPLSDALRRVQSPRQPLTVYASSTASQSNDSLVSTVDPYDETPTTERSTSPSFSIQGTSPATHQHNFPFTPRQSISSTRSFSTAPRPSVSSFHSTSSEVLLWPRTLLPPTTGSNILADLRDALERSNLSDCWADMAGVLLWIGLVVGAASRKDKDKVLRRYFSATTIRAYVMLCFEHPEAMHSTTLRMTQVVEGLSNDGDAQVVWEENEAPTKRTSA